MGQNRDFIIRYRVTGYVEMTAGPYTLDEVESQRADIASFEGVEYAFTEAVAPPTVSKD